MYELSESLCPRKRTLSLIGQDQCASISYKFCYWKTQLALFRGRAQIL